MKKNKLHIILTFLLGLQLSLVLVLVGWRVLSGYFETSVVLSDFVFIAVLIVMLVVFYIFARTSKEIYLANQKYLAQQQVILNMDSLNQAMRSQRHDFLNHMQVIYTLIELGDLESAEEYLNKLYGDIGELNQFIKTNDNAINALLQVKSLYAKRVDVDLQMNIKTTLSDFSIPSWEMCRVLGNLLDNAIYEAKGFEPDRRIVALGVSENISSFIFTITNDAEGLESVQIENMFKAGYTTKGSVGEGMGLAIAKEIILNYQGEIYCDLCDNQITFKITVPKQKVKGRLE